MALEIYQKPDLKPDLLGILTEGELLTEDQRRLCSNFLGHNPIDRYTLKEVGDAALQCSRTNFYHVHSEATYTELVNDENQPCRKGEIGRIVVTPLYNFAMPLVRYDTGDYAIAGDNFSRFAGRHCICGTRLLRLERVLGRRRNLLDLAGSVGLQPDIDSVRLYELSGATLWRLVQTASNIFTLELGTNWTLSGQDTHLIAEHARSMLGSDSQIELKRCKLSKMCESSKFEIFTSKIV
jgi:phenylacetate-CoA ligase